MSKSKAQRTESKRHVPIDKLLAYWIDLSKRPTLTQKDFRSFLRKVDETLEYFSEFYGWDRRGDIENTRDKFFRRVSILISWPTLFQKRLREATTR
jgi:hypothetical protein